MEHRRWLPFAIAAVLCLALSFPAHEAQTQKRTTTVTGKVGKAEVYRDKVRSVYIKDAEQGEFLVLRGTDVGKELLTHVGATVKATGYARKTRPGSEFATVLDVLHYEVVPPGGAAPVED